MYNIVLIGMPACGKSTFGVILAKQEKMSFVDTDILIQEDAKESLQNILNSQGREVFNNYERKAGIKAANLKNTVIATGGSMVYYDDVMQELKKSSKIIYIKTPIKDLVKRCYNLKTRGVLLFPGQTLEDLYNERSPLYDKYADYVVNNDNKTYGEVLNEIYDIATEIKYLN